MFCPHHCPWQLPVQSREVKLRPPAGRSHWWLRMRPRVQGKKELEVFCPPSLSPFLETASLDSASVSPDTTSRIDGSPPDQLAQSKEKGWAFEEEGVNNLFCIPDVCVWEGVGEWQGREHHMDSLASVLVRKRITEVLRHQAEKGENEEMRES